MRKYGFGIGVAVFLAFPATAFSQAVEIGPRGIQVEPYYDEPYYHGRSISPPECRELRKACLHKEELGEEGRGNCQRYRHFCRGY